MPDEITPSRRARTADAVEYYDPNRPERKVRRGHPTDPLQDFTSGELKNRPQGYREFWLDKLTGGAAYNDRQRAKFLNQLTGGEPEPLEDYETLETLGREAVNLGNPLADPSHMAEGGEQFVRGLTKDPFEPGAGSDIGLLDTLQGAGKVVTSLPVVGKPAKAAGRVALTTYEQLRPAIATALDHLAHIAVHKAPEMMGFGEHEHEHEEEGGEEGPEQFEIAGIPLPGVYEDHAAEHQHENEGNHPATP